MTETTTAGTMTLAERIDAVKTKIEHGTIPTSMQDYHLLLDALDALRALADMRADRARLTQALEAAREYFDQRSDADHNGRSFIANDAMAILQQINEALK